MDRFVGDLQLTITDGGDEFYLIGDDRNQPTLPGELCYKDDVGAFCRCFNWRDGERTMITNQTQNAFLVIELLDDSREQAFREALDFIQQAATLHLGASVEQQIVTLQETAHYNKLGCSLRPQPSPSLTPLVKRIIIKFT